MKYLPFIVLVLAGCQAAMDTGNSDTGDVQIDIGGEHMGCQEGEIVDGQCMISDNNNAGLFEQDVDTYVDTQTVENGFLAMPKEPGNYPGIVMIHEWWGLNDNIKFMAKLLAKQGYVVYAVDLYGG